jgi:hypothetical protein
MQRRGQPLGWALLRPLGDQARSRQHGQNRARTPALRPPRRSLRFSVCLDCPACALPFVRQVGGDPSKMSPPVALRLVKLCRTCAISGGSGFIRKLRRKMLWISRKGPTGWVEYLGACQVRSRLELPASSNPNDLSSREHVALVSYPISNHVKRREVCNCRLHSF